jgi:Co/Zn/Cd efflux system component
MLADALSALGVVIAGALILAARLSIADPMISIAFGAH